MAIAVTAAAYLACVQAGYIWDDEALILLNSAISEPTFRKLLGSDLWCCSGTDPSGYWRPLTTLSFFLDVKLFGYAPGPAHLHSLGWHLLATFGVGLLVRQRHGETRGALAAMIFGLHPVSSEAVVWIAARNDLMACAFCVLAIWAMDTRRPWTAAAAGLLAGLSKESSFLLPGLALCWWWGHEAKRPERGWWAVLLGLSAALGLRQLAVLGDRAEIHRVPLDDAAWASMEAFARMLGWLVWPWPLTSTATLYLPGLSASGWAAAGIAVVIAIGCGLRLGRLGGATLGFIGLAMAPMVLAITTFGTVGERYLYLPMVGVAALVGMAAPMHRAVAGAVGVWVCGALITLHVRLPDWVDPLALFQAAARRAPDSYSWNLLGAELARLGAHDRALPAFERSIAAVPNRRFSCARVGASARAALPLAEFKARIPAWRAAGCEANAAFGPSMAWSLALLGDAQGALGETRETPSAIYSGVRAWAAAQDGDLVGAAIHLATAEDATEARRRFGELSSVAQR